MNTLTMPRGTRQRRAASFALFASFLLAASGPLLAAGGFNPGSAAQLGFTEVVTNAAGEVEAAYGETELVAHNAAQMEALSSGALGNAFGFSADDAMRVVKRQVAPEGKVYYRMRQTYKGLPVWRGEMTVQTSAGGKVNAILGRLIDIREVDTHTDAKGIEAVERALQAYRSAQLRDAGLVTLEVNMTSRPTLGIYTAPGREPVLAWDAGVSYNIPGEDFVERVFVDVREEVVLIAYTEIRTAINRRAYDLDGGCTHVVEKPYLPPVSILPGPLVLSEGGTSSVQTVNNAFSALGHTYWFFSNSFGRDSYDGQGAPMDITVNAAFMRGDFSCPDGDNAFWDGSRMVLGVGGSYFHNLANNPDVTYHELGHAVTQYTSGLVYAGESGAMNEANSDIYSAAVTAWMNTVQGQPNASTPMNFAPDAAAWTIGEGLLVGTQSPLRDMRNPALQGNFDHYSAYTAVFPPGCIPHGGNDFCGVHSGSGVANLMFHLLSEGGSHPVNGSRTSVHGIGVQRAVKYLHEANDLVVSSTARFSDFRNAMMTRARANGTIGACDEVSIAAAWTVVGVSGTAPSDPGACSTSSPADAYEPDDSREQYTALYEGAPQVHNFHTSQDQDWMAFAVLPNVISRVTLQGAVAANTELQLYRHHNHPDPNGLVELVATSVNQAGQLVVEHHYSGNESYAAYYVRARPSSGSSAALNSNYTISVNVDLPPDSFEPDNTRQDYTALYEGSPQVHNFHASQDEDWVAFAVLPNVTSRITLEGSVAANTELQMYRYHNHPDPNGVIEFVATSVNQAGQLVVEHHYSGNEPYAAYYVRARPSSNTPAALNSNYTIFVTVLP